MVAEIATDDMPEDYLEDTGYLELPRDLTRALIQLGDAHAGDLVSVLAAVLQTLIHRYSRQDDVLVEVRDIDRGVTETVRADCAGNPSFSDLLSRSLPHVAAQNVELRDGGPGSDLQPYAIEFAVHRAVDGPQVRYRYTPRRGAWQQSLAHAERHVPTLVHAIVHEANQGILDLPLMDARERAEILSWNLPAPEAATFCSIAALFEAQVKASPQAIAIVHDQDSITFGELNRMANQLAHRLLAMGIKPEDTVGIALPRSIDMMIALLGILKSGGAYVPIDPAYPAERIAYILEDSCLSVLVTHREIDAHLPQNAATRVYLDDKDTESEPGHNPPDTIQADQLAYVIYTSGSTGKPKGVLIEHASLARYAQVAAQAYDIAPTDRVLQFAPISFDASIDEIFPCLINGGTLVLRTDWMLAGVPTFLEACADWGVTVLDLPTAYWHEIVTELADGTVRMPAAVRLVVMGGERAIPHKVASWLRLVGDEIRLINSYGPTEATVVATMCELTSAKPENVLGAEVSIGRPIAGARAYILDPQDHLVPIGVPGELHIGGFGLARGYLNRPELTAEKFIPDPFLPEAEGRIYRSGDLVRADEHGEIEYLGRVDQQVKIRGFRIELGEIEAVLDQHPAVRQSVVVARDDAQGDRYLVGYAVLQDSDLPSVADLRSWIREQLPEYMVPMTVVFLDSLPLTPNDKVDRKALPPPGEIELERSETYVAPRTLLHHQLVQIWEELLHVKGVGITDNFFELGGHSLLAARLLQTIEEITGKKIPFATLFESATVEHLTQALVRRHDGEVQPLVVEIQPGQDVPFFFLHGDIVGGGFYSRKLSHYLGEQQPFYVLQPHGIDGQPIPETIEEMAAVYVGAIRSIWTTGPYRIGGYCDAGIIAYEVARQLAEDGSTVDALVLINSEVPRSRARGVHAAISAMGSRLGWRKERQIALYRALHDMAGDMQAVEATSTWEYAREVPALAKRAMEYSRRAARLRPQDPGEGESFEEHRRRQMDPYLWAAAGYRPRRFPGRVTLMWPGDEPAPSRGPATGWDGLAREVEICPVPGTHSTCITEHVESLAGSLSRRLAEVQAEVAAPVRTA